MAGSQSCPPRCGGHTDRKTPGTPEPCSLRVALRIGRVLKRRNLGAVLLRAETELGQLMVLEAGWLAPPSRAG